MSSFDEPKNYYVFKYIVDSVTGEPTEHAGEIQAFVKATDPWDAVEKAGLDDMNKYGANRVDKLEDFEKAIAEERKLLKKISKELKGMKDEEQAERDRILAERECPNGCGKMDEKFRCKNCGFGYEGEQLVKDLDELIKKAKKDGEDTTELESLRDSIKKGLEEQENNS